MRCNPSARAAWPAGIIAALCLWPASAGAWFSTGHMITAQIAYDELTDDARREVDRLVAVLAPFSPEHDHAVTASRWADDLRLQGVEAFSGWHYINLPFEAEGHRGTLPPQPENVVWAIRQAAAALRSEAGDLPKALMLRFLLHLVGDAHQPLHCASRFSAEWPAGDRGGNDFLIANGQEPLHRFWDSAAELFPEADAAVGPWRPLIRRLSDDVTRRVPKQAVPHWIETDPDIWARESFALAVNTAYAGIAEGGVPSRAYVRRARRTVRRQLALGGYRLGALLNEIFGRDPG